MPLFGRETKIGPGGVADIKDPLKFGRPEDAGTDDKNPERSLAESIPDDAAERAENGSERSDGQNGAKGPEQQEMTPDKKVEKFKKRLSGDREASEQELEKKQVTPEFKNNFGEVFKSCGITVELKNWKRVAIPAALIGGACLLGGAPLAATMGFGLLKTYGLKTLARGALYFGSGEHNLRGRMNDLAARFGEGRAEKKGFLGIGKKAAIEGIGKRGQDLSREYQGLDPESARAAEIIAEMKRMNAEQTAILAELDQVQERANELQKRNHTIAAVLGIGLSVATSMGLAGEFLPKAPLGFPADFDGDGTMNIVRGAHGGMDLLTKGAAGAEWAPIGDSAAGLGASYEVAGRAFNTDLLMQSSGALKSVAALAAGTIIGGFAPGFLKFGRKVTGELKLASGGTFKPEDLDGAKITHGKVDKKDIPQAEGNLFVNQYTEVNKEGKPVAHGAEETRWAKKSAETEAQEDSPFEFKKRLSANILGRAGLETSGRQELNGTQERERIEAATPDQRKNLRKIVEGMQANPNFKNMDRQKEFDEVLRRIIGKIELANRKDEIADERRSFQERLDQLQRDLDALDSQGKEEDAEEDAQADEAEGGADAPNLEETEGGIDYGAIFEKIDANKASINKALAKIAEYGWNKKINEAYWKEKVVDLAGLDEWRDEFNGVMDIDQLKERVQNGAPEDAEDMEEPDVENNDSATVLKATLERFDYYKSDIREALRKMQEAKLPGSRIDPMIHMHKIENKLGILWKPEFDKAVEEVDVDVLRELIEQDYTQSGA